VKNAHGAALAITWYPAKRQGVVEAAWRDPVLDDDLPLHSYRRGHAVSAEALLLALSSVIRPTTLTAVYAMALARDRRRLLSAYLIAGLTFSLLVGILVVVVLKGYSESGLSTFWRAVLDVGLGAAACGFAVGAATRRRPDSAATNRQTAAWLRHRLDNITTTRAALIGVVTHLPGLVYLAALNAIVNAAATPLGAAAQVVAYNVIWYSVAIAAFFVSVSHPAAPTDLLNRADELIRRHGRSIVVVVFGAIGVYLLWKGLSILLGW
jgi:hypothetical protein